MPAQWSGGIYDSGNLAADRARTGINLNTGLTDPQYNEWFGSQLQEQQMQAEADLQAQAEQRRMQYLSQVMDKLNGVGAGGGPLAEVTYNSSGIQSAEDAANQAAYAKAKDVAGQTGRAAMTALQNNLAGRGLAGSKIGNQAAAQVVNTGATQLGDINRQQLTDTLNRNRQMASEQFQGGIAQRGQDVTMRGQNINAVTAPLSALLTSRAY